MSPSTTDGRESFDVAYLVLSGTTTAARCPELLRALVGLGFATVIAIPTPNASRVIAPRDLDDVEGVQVVESYFDLAIRPRPPRGVVLFAPCSFNSLNKLAHGIADNLALSVVAEAIGRGTPVIVGPSLNAPLLAHPQAQASLRLLPQWGVTIVPPVDEGEGPRLAPTAVLVDAVRPHVRRLTRTQSSQLKKRVRHCERSEAILSTTGQRASGLPRPPGTPASRAAVRGPRNDGT
jgi:phosphopantothenoylcysteine synthetase/decarboxylase